MISNSTKLRLVYISALSCIAVLSIGSHLYLRTIEESLVSDAPAINTAGRQRMLSQRIANLAQQLYMNVVVVDMDRAAVNSIQLRESLNEWETAHRGLRVRNGAYGLSGSNTPAVAEELARVEDTLDDTVVRVRDFLLMTQNTEAFSGASASDAVAEIMQGTETYLLQMEYVVTLLTDDSVTNLKRLQNVELAAMLFTIALIVLLAFGAFEPAIKTLTRQASDLVALRAAIDEHTLFSVTDRRGRILEANDGFCEISGYSREELVGATHAMLNSGFHPRSFWTDMWQTIAGGKAWRKEVCNRAKDGSRYWVDTTNIPQFDRNGKIERFISLRFDVTDQKKAEASRKEAHNQLESILNAASQFAIISVDIEGRIETFNSGAVNMLGYSAEEVIGKRMTDVYLLSSEVLELAERLSGELGREIQPWAAPAWNARRGGHDRNQWTHVCRDGRHLTVVTTVTGIFDADGQITGYVGISQDISDRLAAEHALEKQREEQRAIIDAIPSYVWYKSRDQKIIDCNIAAADSLGMDRDDIRGRSTSELLSADVSERHTQADTEALEGGIPTLGHIEKIGEGEDAKYLRMDKTPLKNDAGEFDRIVVIATDISDMVRANAQLREAEERLDMALDASSTGLWDWNIITGGAYFNDVVLRLLGYGRGELDMTISTWKKLCHPDDLSRASAALDDHIAGKTDTYSCEYRIRRKDGEYRWVRDVGQVVERDTNQIPCRIVGVYVDIQALRDALGDVERSNERLQESQQRFEHAIEGSRDAIFDWDIESGSVYFSPRWLELLKIDEAALGSSIPDLLFHTAPEDAERVNRELEKFVASSDDRFESEFQLVDGKDQIVWVMMRAFASRDVAGAAVRVAGSVADITALKEAQEAMRRLVQQDQLTGLASRSRLTERLEHAVTRARRNRNHCGVLFFDFDRFKVVNDSLGHDVGDELLCSIAERMRENLREVDTPARFGGDEFVVLLEDIDGAASAKLVADKLLGVFNEPHQIQGHSLISTASIGVVTSEHADSTGLELLGYADAAMYEAKRRGRACVVEFDQAMYDAQQQRAELEEELLSALPDEQLEVYFQPIVDLESGSIVSCEALLRWQHPTKGFVSPAVFIPIAEESKQIVQIGEWVIEESCRRLSDWLARGIVGEDFAVSVNASKVQLLTPGFEEMLIGHINAHGLPRSAIKVEVTETTIVDNRSDIGQVLHSLREQSIIIMMDDFGTGHSSLSVLHNLPIDELKIDQSFIRHADKNRELVAITSSIVTLAEHLSLKTIGEGIESPHHITLLQTLGCTYGQGYYWSKPLPAAEVESLLVEFEPISGAMLL